MRRLILRMIIIAAIAGISAALSVAPASAQAALGQEYGPYSSQGTCEYWKNAVAATGATTVGCYRYNEPLQWYFYAY